MDPLSPARWDLKIRASSAASLSQAYAEAIEALSEGAVTATVQPTADYVGMLLYGSHHGDGDIRPVFHEDVAELVASGGFPRRGMSNEDSARAHLGEIVARNGFDPQRAAWARRTAADYLAGRLPRDPDHPDAYSGYVDRFGLPLTNGDLHAIYWEDLPHGD